MRNLMSRLKQQKTKIRRSKYKYAEKQRNRTLNSNQKLQSQTRYLEQNGIIQ